MRISLVAAMAAAVLSLVIAAPAMAAPETQTFRFGPLKVGPYEVKQSDFSLDVPKPVEDGYITRMEVDIVDADGKKVPISRLMLHHIVFSNLGPTFGSKRDHTCNAITGLDSETEFPNVAERFYAAGEERAKLRLPKGYGYPVKGNDKWALTYMLMNHRNRTDTAYVQYKVTYEKAEQKPVVPYWLDVRNCLADPVFDVPGGRKRGSTFRRSMNWTVPQSGRLVASIGHVHGGAHDLTLNRGKCELYASKPTWGRPGHPFYNVKPILHEPGPINMSGFSSGRGFAVRRGQKLRLDANYDGELVHTRVMGIMLAYLAPDSTPGKARGCERPPDLRNFGSAIPGRKRTPRFKVPIIGIGPNGVAREIVAPPGPRRRLRGSGTTIKVGDRFFAKPNVAIKAGSAIRWRFTGSELHNVTVASGPRGFSSQHLDGGRTYRRKLRAPGVYRLFCGLHPVEMTATVKVTRPRRH